MKNSKIQARTNRKPALSHISAAVVATLIAGGAQAAETTVVNIAVAAPTGTAVGEKVINQNLTNSAPVGATVNANVGVNVGAPVPGATTVNTTEVNQNLLRAVAVGNNFASLIELESAVSNGTPNAGAVTLGTAVNTGVISSSVTGSTLGNSFTNFNSGAAVANGNTIAAETTVNQGSSTITGDVQTGFGAGTQAGSAVVDPASAPNLRATGSIVTSTLQISSESGSSATVGGNQISVNLPSTGTNTVAASPEVNDNTIAATFRGNRAANVINVGESSLEAGASAPTFTGSAVAANTQVRAGGPSSATNSSSTILGNVAAASGVNTLNGTLSVAANSITSAATGNDATVGTTGTAGNRVLLSGGISFQGAGTGAPGSSIAYVGGVAPSSVDADLVIANNQASAFSNLTSTTAGANVLGFAQSLSGGGVALTGNAISATSTGNTAGNEISNLGDGTTATANSFVGSAAIASQQTQVNTLVNATTVGTLIHAQTGFNAGATDTAAVTVDGNQVTATAAGNRVDQRLTLAANELAPGAGVVSLTGGAGTAAGSSTIADAAGIATVSNLQNRVGSAVQAANIGSTIEQVVSSASAKVDDSKLSVSGNTQQASALGSGAANLLTLAGTNVGTGAGVANLQIGDAASAVTADLTGATALLAANAALVGGSATLAKNQQYAVGVGNSATNTLAVKATNLAPVAVGSGPASAVEFDSGTGTGLAFDSNNATQPQVTAAYGVLSNQSQRANVTATAFNGAAASINLQVAGSVSGGTVVNESNTLAAEGYGNLAQNGLTLDGKFNLTNPDSAGYANVTNVQAVGATIAAVASGSSSVRTTVTGGLSDSSITTSGNRIQALANGSLAQNDLSVTANNIDSSGLGLRGAYGLNNGGTTTTSLADASFSVQNAQSGQGAVEATQRSLGTAANVRVQVNGGVLNGSIAADANVSNASATSNSAESSLALTGNQLATSSVVRNLQSTSAGVSSLIGQAGEGVVVSVGGAISDAELSVSRNLTTGTATGNRASNSVSVTGTDLSAGGALGGLAAAGVLSAPFGNLYGNGALGDHALSSQQSATGAVTSGVLGTYAIVAPASIQRASLDVNGNRQTASAIANTADNALAVKGNSVSAGTALQSFQVGNTASATSGASFTAPGAVSSASVSINGNSNSAQAIVNDARNSHAVTGNSVIDNSVLGGIAAAGDVTVANPAVAVAAAIGGHVLANGQAATGAAFGAVTGSYVVGAGNSTPTDATLSINGNSQSATALGNTAGNALSVRATNLAAGSALQSSQVGSGAATANSVATFQAPAAVTNSTVTLSNNGNTALASVNDVSNTLTVVATNIEANSAGLPAALGNTSAAPVTIGGITVGGGGAIGDHVLANHQTAQVSAPVSSNATSVLGNNDGGSSANGLVNSTLTIAGNSTVAEGTANRAVNTASVTGSALQGASAAVANLQNSASAVNVYASTSANATLAGGVSGAANNSTISFDGNSTTALARGNAATNVLNAGAGSSFGTTPIGATDGSVALSPLQGNVVLASAGVLNSQGNTGAVSANASSTGYYVALNAGGAAGGVVNSSVGVTGNLVAAEAYGNSATNRLTLTPLNTGTPTAAVANYQANSGTITAVATSVNYGVGVTGAATGSSLRTSSNQVTATAVGNSAVSSILAGR